MTPIVYGPQFDRLRSAHVVLSARARRHEVSGFPGPLSVKTVVKGEALWRVGGKAFTVDATACLIVDRDEPYDMAIDAIEPVETFVVFFADGFVADVATTRFSTLEHLLDREGESDDAPMPVTRRLWDGQTALAAAMRALRHTDQAAQGAADRGLRTILDACADLSAEARIEADRIKAARAATRAELHRRVVRGKGLLDETLAEPFDLAAAAREACMAEHHFHRTFAAASARRRTPTSSAAASTGPGASWPKTTFPSRTCASRWATRVCPPSPRASAAPRARAPPPTASRFARADNPHPARPATSPPSTTETLCASSPQL